MINFKKKPSIKICYAFDNKVVYQAIISMMSILENTNSKIDFVILHSNLSSNNISIIKYLKKYRNCNLIFKEINPDIFKGFKNANWVTIHNWFYTLVPHLYPKENKFIYLDSDTLILKDISEHWNIDLSNKLIAASPDIYSYKKNIENLNMKSSTYINAGVLLINCKKWREINLFEDIKKNAINNPKIIYGDQDVLNKVVDEDKLLISPKYNLIEDYTKNFKNNYKDEFFSDYENRKKTAVIVHFAGNKPFQPETQNSFKDVWWDYASRTPFYKKLLIQYKKDSDILIKSIYAKMKENYLKEKGELI